MKIEPNKSKVTVFHFEEKVTFVMNFKEYGRMGLKFFSMNTKAKLQSIINLRYRIFRPLRTYFNEYCGNTSIHGFRYFTTRFLHWSERLWWIIAFVMSVWMCGSLIHNIWTKWHNNPVTMSFTEKDTLISTIPFPTVTICPEIKTKKHKFNLSSALQSFPNLSEVEFARLNALAHLCTQLPDLIEYDEKFANDSIYDTIFEIGLNSSNSIEMCRWQHFLTVPCRGVLEIRSTDEGACFTYNSLTANETYTNEISSEITKARTIHTHEWNVENWSFESGYKFEFGDSRRLGVTSMYEYPRRMNDSSRAGAFSVQFVTDVKNFEYKYRGIDQGFKLALTVPGEAVTMTRNFFRIPLSESTLIIMKPKLITASEGIRKYSPQQRQCYFNAERQLRFYKTYAQSSCEVECLSNFTKIECGCVKFSMPRDENTRICGAANVKCYRMAEKKLAKSAESFRENCNCLPTCIQIEYHAEIDRVGFNIEAYRKEKSTQVEIFYKSHQIQTTKRVELYTFFEFMAICGGLLGLCLGISFLSIIEIVYYSTLRLFWTICQPRSNQVAVAAPRPGGVHISISTKIRRNLRSFFVELCDDSNIHGLRYFTERILHWTERLWWIIWFGLSLWLCSLMIRNTWTEWQLNPVMMRASETTDASISAIPFPTVTICTETKTLKHKFDLLNGISEQLKTESEFIKYSMILHICTTAVDIIRHYIRDNNNVPFSKSIMSYNYTNDSIYDTLADLAPTFNDVIYKCWWQGSKSSCSKCIQPVFTEDGVFTFNALNSHEIYTDEMAPGMKITKDNPDVSGWSLENGYHKMSGKEYPLRIVDSGKDVALTLSTRNFDYFCKGFDQGFRVTLSVPGDEVKIARNSLRVPVSENSIITITPKMTTTSKGLRHYEPNQRQCFYNSERKLRFYKIYTKNNCEMECLANFTKSECGCVKFSMPRDRNTLICGTANIKCYQEAEVTLFSESLKNRCNCWPACTSIEYNVNIDHVSFDSEAVNQIRDYHSNDSSIQQTKLSIFFKDNQVETVMRMEVYTFADFLAICGGLLGLFLGFSALSIIELLYYLTLHLFWNIRHSRFGSNADQ